jgi:hypothetical protein
VLWPPTFASADAVDVCAVFSNIGFENGDLTNWTLTRPNTNFVASLSPAVNPTIDPADAANSPVVLVAAVGSYFTGLKRPGDEGLDLSYKLAHDAIAIDVPSGTTFQVVVWANRGRLEPFDTPGSTADVLVRMHGWTAGATPIVTAATDNWSRSIHWSPASQSFDFTGVADGDWAARTFVFDPAADGRDAANVKRITITLAGRTHNHDQYVAIDLCDGVTQAESATWGRVKAIWR